MNQSNSKMWVTLILIVMGLLAFTACGGGGGGGGGSASSTSETVPGDTASNENSNGDSTTFGDTGEGSSTTDGAGTTDGASDDTISMTDDVCGNDLGNGNEIINGPTAPDGVEDHDSVFRSLAVHPTDANIVILGTERNGFVKSSDGGNSWVRLRQGLRHTTSTNGDVYPEIWDIAFDSNNPDTIYAATLDSPGPVTGSHPSSIAGVYKSADGGTTWSRKNCGLSNSRITSVQVDASDSNIVFIGVEAGVASFTALQGQLFSGGIFRSTDAGENWSVISVNHSDADQNGYWHIRSAASAGGAFLSFGFWSFQNSGTNALGNVGFLKTTDSGATWSLLGADVQSLIITQFGVSSDGQTVYANERDSFVIQKSTDGGTTWNATSINQANGPVAVSPNDSDLVLYGSSATLYRSTDGVSNVQSVLQAAASIEDIVIAPSNPNIVYAAANGYLIYKSTDAGATFSLVKNIRSDVLNQ